MSVRDTLDELARSVLDEDTAPVAAVGWGALTANGERRIELGGASDVLFDLASVSKSFTAVALARSGVAPDRLLGEQLGELADTASASATLEQLLGHRAGLAAHLELFAPLREALREGRAAPAFSPAAAYRHVAEARRPECTGPVPPSGFPALYSDLGYMLAGLVLARHTGAPDAGAAIEATLVPALGLAGALGTARGLGVGAAYAATEEVDWRHPSPLVGIVHDENAWLLTGEGGSGHAGLFGTVGAVVEFGLEVLRMLRGQGKLAVAHDVGWLVRPVAGTTWRAGFDGKSAVGSSAGAFASADTFGHLGFTGTSLWIDPARDLVVSLLCTRVNPSRDRQPHGGGIKVTRPRVHDALFRQAAAETAAPLLLPSSLR